MFTRNRPQIAEQLEALLQERQTTETRLQEIDTQLARAAESMGFSVPPRRTASMTEPGMTNRDRVRRIMGSKPLSARQVARRARLGYTQAAPVLSYLYTQGEVDRTGDHGGYRYYRVFPSPVDHTPAQDTVQQ